jgi:hypothetical protein
VRVRVPPPALLLFAGRSFSNGMNFSGFLALPVRGGWIKEG